jgi:hypothetical protein
MFNQTLKRLLALSSILALLFAQLAVAAYACPATGGAANVLAAASDDAMHSAMPGCEMNTSTGEKRDSNPNLCLQHCQAGEQSVQTLPHLPVPAFAAISALTVLEPVLVQTIDALQSRTAWSVQVPLPPPLVRFGVLRI